MTYCVGLALDQGLVFLSDTRTNAGVDNISTFGKMHVVEVPGERVIVALTAGNLAITQAVMTYAMEGRERDGEETLYTVRSLYGAAELVGRCMREVYERDGAGLKDQNIPFDGSILLGGQIAGRTMRLFNIYAAGNFIEATRDTPFLQMGEHKYGKPILDRVVTYDTGLRDGVMLALLSMDSTLRSNLTVGLPVDLAVYPRDGLRLSVHHRITGEDTGFRQLSDQWSEELRDAYGRLTPLSLPGMDRITGR